jgi:hypothetical protein
MLPAVAEIISPFFPSLQHLILDIKLYQVYSSSANLTKIDFSPLASLGRASLSIPRIDLYVHTGILPSAVTRAQILSSMEDYEVDQRWVLVIQSEETAPDGVQAFDIQS